MPRATAKVGDRVGYFDINLWTYEGVVTAIEEGPGAIAIVDWRGPGDRVTSREWIPNLRVIPARNTQEGR